MASKVEQVSQLQDKYQALKAEISKLVVGQEEAVDQLLLSIFCNSHCLLVGVPGLAKTLMINTLSKALGLSFNRIQFTPDLMPSDILGSEILDEDRHFKFIKGPIFANIILADEINRTPPKTQAALLEAMQERAVTVAGHHYKLSLPYFVLATQNPIEQEGTYKLPEAQLDRFVFKIKLDYPSLEEEKAILYRFREDFSMRQVGDVKAVMDATEIKECQNIIEQVYIKDQLLDYIAGIINNTRNNGDLYLGASPRASLAIMRTSKAIAAMNGRDFVTPDDIKTVAYPVLNHRIILMPEREMEGFTTKDIIEDIIKKIEVPR